MQAFGSPGQHEKPVTSEAGKSFCVPSKPEHLGCRMVAEAGVSYGRPWMKEEAAEKIDAGLRAALAG